MEQEQEYDRATNSKIHYLDFSKKGSSSKRKINKGSKQTLQTKILPTISGEVRALKPALPLYCIRPNSIKRAANFFLENF